MAKKKKKVVCPEMPAWLITFSDMMTLMLTFFVLLVSMATIDESRKLVVLGSVMGTFGYGTKSYDVLTRSETKRSVEPGPMEKVPDLQPLKNMLWEDSQEDLRFESNRFVQVFSVNADLLFAQGRTELMPEGQTFLSQLVPTLSRIDQPLLLAGHTSNLRDELGTEFRLEDRNRIPDLSWKLSLGRIMSVYRHLVVSGLDAQKLKVEAFGKYQPHFTQETAKGRSMNRRVDIVLDKRSGGVSMAAVERQVRENRKDDNLFDADGFIFKIKNPAEQVQRSKPWPRKRKGNVLPLPPGWLLFPIW